MRRRRHGTPIRHKYNDRDLNVKLEMPRYNGSMQGADFHELTKYLGEGIFIQGIGRS